MDKQGEHAWLEEVLGDRALGWVKSENNKTVSALGNPEGSPLYNRVLGILTSKDKIPQIRKIGDLFYNFWQDEANPRGLIRRCTLESYRSGKPDWETVLDLDALGKAEGESWVFKGQVNLDDGTVEGQNRTLLMLSRGGADATVVREFNYSSNSFIKPESGGFVVPEAKSRVTWRDKDTLVLGTDMGNGTLTDSGYPRCVYEWKRGTPLSSARLTFEGDKTDVSVSSYFSRHREHVAEWRYRAVNFYEGVYEVRLCDSDGQPTSEWVSLEGVIPADASIRTFADCALIELKSPWRGFAEGSLLSIPLTTLLAGKLSDDNQALTVLFEPRDGVSLDASVRTRNLLLLSTLDHVKSRIVFWRYEDGKWVPAGSEDKPMIRGASLRAVDDDESDNMFLTTASFTSPSTLSLVDASRGPQALSVQEKDVLRRLPDMFDASNVSVTQGFATSKDGTKVPYFLIRPQQEEAGPQPTLLYGYGGFLISLTPAYSATVGAGWVERGGAYVIANIRGGGEYGPKWFEAARKENRNKAYEDMIAVGEDLVRTGVTTPEMLAARGGSNGGLLMGNIMTQRPDLFGAIVCAVPLLDMKRFSHLLAGASWMAEYGNPDTDDWDKFMIKYSAYHNLDPKAKYPPLLMTTSTRDDRVHPYHARAFVKRLQEMGPPATPAPMYYYENMEGGHGGAADAKQQAFMTALYLDFLRDTIGKGKIANASAQGFEPPLRK